MAHLYIAAAHKSSGKTTLAVGLVAALARRGLIVQPFKKGPDFIDPLWLARAAGQPCYNLDFNTMSGPEIDTLFARASAGADISVIEGNKGLYDGMDVEGSDSNAALAVKLGAPVILVVDTTGITRGIAPLVMGYRVFGPDVHIAGVILNKVAGPRHEGKLREALERYSDVPVLGAIQRDASLLAPERHLGLIPPDEAGEGTARICQLADIVEQNVDLDRVIELAQMALPVRPVIALIEAQRKDIRIAVARDTAFGFYYPDDLEALEACGAELVFFSPLSDPHFPPADGLFLGGGFPETHMAMLAANVSLKQDISIAIAGGLPTYAECGGLMYLTNSISWQGEMAAMTGVIDADTVMCDRPQGRGIVRLEETGSSPWGLATGTAFQAHEFHFARLENLIPSTRFAYKVLRGAGLGNGYDGIVQGNLLANFSHLRSTENNTWATRFAAFVRDTK